VAYTAREQIIFGENGGVVEIDESLMRTPKHHRGHPGESRWVFGIYDRNTHNGYLEFVADRTADTLLPIIQRRIAPGATIHSDGWAAYGRIADLPVEPKFKHRVVVHDDAFVDPDDPDLHTPNIETYWKAAKAKFKRMNGTDSSMIPSHLDEFMFRHRIRRLNGIVGAGHKEVLNKLISVISSFQKWLNEQ